MHGRKREEYKAQQRNPKVVLKLTTKALQYHAVLHELHERRRQHRQEEEEEEEQQQQQQQEENETTTTTTGDNNGDDVEKNNINNNNNDAVTTTTTTLSLIEKVLSVNPDPLTLWNHRRELLLLQQQQQQRDSSLCSATSSSSSSSGTEKHRHSENDSATTLQQQMHYFLIDDELRLTQVALTNNPKAYGAWYHRKWSICLWLLLLNQQQQQQQETKDEEDNTKGKKSSNAHQQLLLLLNNELSLIDSFLKRDERNFHCWNYRRYIVSCCFGVLSSSESSAAKEVVAVADGSWNIINNTKDSKDSNHAASTSTTCKIMGAQVAVTVTKMATSSLSFLLSSSSSSSSSSSRTILNIPTMASQTKEVLRREWDFTTTKIHDNFSNYSAFHYRSQLLPVIIIITNDMDHNDNDDNDNTTDILTKELELIENAIFTEPDDQTAWWYQRFILEFATENIVKSSSSSADAMTLWVERMNEHCEMLRELSQEQQQQQHDTATAGGNDGGNAVRSISNSSKWVWLGLLQALDHVHNNDDASSSSSNLDERKDIVKKLILIDPDRKNRYRNMLYQLEEQLEQQ